MLRDWSVDDARGSAHLSTPHHSSEHRLSAPS